MTTLQFTQLYESNYSALFNFARKLSNDIIDAEDLVQETAMKAFRSINTFKVGTSFKSWAFTILKNTFISKYRKDKRRKVSNKPIEEFSFILNDSTVINNDAISQLRIKEIEQSIEDLSYKSRVPFLMYVTGYQYNEIAESLDLPIGTVKSRINFARTKLKSALESKGIEAK